MDEGSAAENLWEKHIHRYLKIWYYVSIRDLNVLYLCCWCLSFETLYTYKLDFDWLYLDIGSLADKVSIKRLIIATVHRCYFTTEMELRHLVSFWVCNKFVRCNGKILGNLALTLCSIYTLPRYFAIEICTSFYCWFSSTSLMHNYWDFIHDWKVDPYVRVWKLGTTSGLKLKWEFQWIVTWEYLSRPSYLYRLAHKHDTFGRVKWWASQFSSNDWNSVHKGFSH